MQSYTPPLGTGSTKDYDRAIRLWTREKRWRAAMLAALAPKPVRRSSTSAVAPAASR